MQLSLQIEAWRNFFERCLSNRLEPNDFTTFATILHQQHPLPSFYLCTLFLSPTPGNNICLDPKASRYVFCLLSLGFVDIPNILRALWRSSTCRAINCEQLNEDQENSWARSFNAEETIFYRLTKIISSGLALKTVKEAVETVELCIQWLEGTITLAQAQHQLQALLNVQSDEVTAQIMATAIAKGHICKTSRKRLGKVVSNFITLMLLHWPQGVDRLEAFRTETLPAIEPVEKASKSGVDKDIEDIIGEGISGAISVNNMVVSEMDEVNTRVGLYIFLSSLLVGRPLIDDNAIFKYLNNRYQGDLRSTVVDLILAAFDVLANAMVRNEKDQTKNLLRCFLINKLPHLLSTLCTQLFPPITSEICITEALSQVDTTNFPTLSAMFDETSGNNMFPESVRQDFCFACCLHGLIAESSIETLLGDVPIQSLPAEGRYLKNELVQKCLSESDRVERMIDELEYMDGNVGANSQAITELITRLCNNKETMALKSICDKLVRNPSSLDIMLLFDKPISILQPICDLLDNWHYDEDQGEYQPVYEEFGSILLLLLSFVKRYDLTPLSLGPRSSDSFVLKIIQVPRTTSHSSLSQTTQSHLKSWLLGLFSPENSGLTDDLMSSCPPQDFYLLIPFLFSSIVLASSTYGLVSTTLSSGLEYLVDTFLLPSLVPGISFLATHLWENHGDKDAVVQILSSLIITPLSNTNNINSEALEHSLRWLQRAEPQRQDIEPLSKALRCYLGWERCAVSQHTELENWTSTNGGGLLMAIKQTITNLLQWHLQPDANPANYTHRQILVGVKILGAKRVIKIIVEELKSGIEAGHGGAALDIASALVSSSDATAWDSTFGLGSAVGNNEETRYLQRRMNLREALKNEAYNAPKLQRTDPFTAETIVRLYRKVESLVVNGNIEGHEVLTAAELNAVVDMSGLAQTDGTHDDISGLENIATISGLDMGHMVNFDGLDDGFAETGVNLMIEGDFMRSEERQGTLLEGMEF
ncbi:RNA polymerase II mediator complex subunit/Nut1 [Blumeria hordei DH14]|uniref:Mediator of RNA polymerase II transcription subunit 5 n=1 Tax=Blumeria graminis f. sp. hordei (strain DH14) TaxID=546991 RepID=N1JGR6_BLUG1|nr:RNA polymerase II mediator complex subunit/Nut1 [Blumeria hordei DH14]